MPRWSRMSVIAGALCLLGGVAHAAAVAAKYAITATLSHTAPQLRGTVETTIRNPTAQPLREIVVLLFPNRFATADEGINDANRPFVYPREDFDPGGMTVGDVRVDGQPVVSKQTTIPGIPAGCVLALELSR